MINHITLRVSSLKESKEFYSLALKSLGYALLKEDRALAAAGYGTENKEGKRDFWIKEDLSSQPCGSFSCLAFTASSKQMVDDFYKNALAAGGKDNGAPGYRPQYHPGYYAAFVFDPDGHNIEAIFDDSK